VFGSRRVLISMRLDEAEQLLDRLDA